MISIRGNRLVTGEGIAALIQALHAVQRMELYPPNQEKAVFIEQKSSPCLFVVVGVSIVPAGMVALPFAAVWFPEERKREETNCERLRG